MIKFSHSPSSSLRLTFHFIGGLSKRTLFLPPLHNFIDTWLTRARSISRGLGGAPLKEACLKWNLLPHLKMWWIKFSIQFNISSKSVERTALNATGHQKFTALQITPQKKSGPRRGGGREKLEEREESEKERRKHSNIFGWKCSWPLFSLSSLCTNFKWDKRLVVRIL